MRQIRFRAWDNETKEMIRENVVPLSNSQILTYVDNKLKRTFNSKGALSMLPVVVMQFTGLKDKNGKRIYEGDIIEFKPLIEKRNNTKRIIVSIPSIYFNLNINNVEEKNVAIIGNKFENPELLE